MKDFEDDALYVFCKKQHQQFNSLYKRRKHSFGPKSFPDFIRTADISVWGGYEYSNFLILSVVIQWILDTYIFEEQYPIGITPTQAKVLREVENGMNHPSQARGKLSAHVRFWVRSLTAVPTGQQSIENWRFETLTALTMLPNREKSRASIFNQAKGILSLWLLDAVNFAKLEKRLQEEILDPAIELHQDIRLSSHQYRMNFDYNSEKALSQQLLDEVDLKDADTWGALKKGSQFGRVLHYLHPPLVRLLPNGRAPLFLVKAVLVVTDRAREAPPSQHSKDGELCYAEEQTIPPVVQHALAETEITNSPSISGDSDSNPTDRSRRSINGDRRSHSRQVRPRLPRPKIDTGGTRIVPRESSRRSEGGRQLMKKDQDYAPGPDAPQASVTAEVARDHPNFHQEVRSRREEETRPIGRREEIQHGQSRQLYGINEEGNAYSLAPPRAATHPPRRGSDTPGGKDARRKSVVENPQGPTSTSSSVPSSPAIKDRGSWTSEVIFAPFYRAVGMNKPS